MSKEPFVATSPHYTHGQLPSPISIDVMIDVFADRVRGWQLDIAQQLESMPHAGFAVLAIVASYFEMYAKHESGYAGTHAVREHFDAGVRAVLEPHIDPPGTPIPEPILEMLYQEVRCGMYHEGMTGSNVLISDAPGIPLIQMDNGRVVLDPHQLVRVVQDHFSRYVLRLRDPEEVLLRENFKKRFLR